MNTTNIPQDEEKSKSKTQHTKNTYRIWQDRLRRFRRSETARSLTKRQAFILDVILEHYNIKHQDSFPQYRHLKTCPSLWDGKVRADLDYLIFVRVLEEYHRKEMRDHSHNLYRPLPTDTFVEGEELKARKKIYADFKRARQIRYRLTGKLLSGFQVTCLAKNPLLCAMFVAQYNLLNKGKTG